MKSSFQDHVMSKPGIRKTGTGLMVPASTYTELAIMGNCTVRREKSLLDILESSEMPFSLKRGE